MPRKANISLKRWKFEFPSTLSNNFDFISGLFEDLKLLYPELGKLHPDLGVLEFALGNVDEFWVVSLDVYDGDARSESPSNDSGLRLLNANGKKGAGAGFEAGSGFDALITFPAYQPTDDDSPSGSSGTSSSTSLNHHRVIPDLTTPNLGKEKAALSKAPILEPIELPPLLEFDTLTNPGDHEYDGSIEHRLANGISEQHVVGLAFAVPSTIHIPELDDSFQDDDDGHQNDKPSKPPLGSRGGGGGGIRSYDIGLLLQLDPIRERLLELGISCLSRQDEENHTKDAIFQILLDLEAVLDPSVLQFQVIMTPSVDWLHDKILEAFVSMGFFREGKGKVLNFRGYEELVTVLSMRMGEWEHHKRHVWKVPEGRRPNKGKGKAEPVG